MAYFRVEWRERMSDEASTCRNTLQQAEEFAVTDENCQANGFRIVRVEETVIKYHEKLVNRCKANH